MNGIALLAIGVEALAAPRVVCDQLEADKLVEEALIEVANVPRSHPYLIPGLALASGDTDDALRDELKKMCDSGHDLSYYPAESWDSATYSAHTFVFTTNREEGCTLFQQAIAVTVGFEPGEADARLRFGLRDRLPATHLPLGECETVGTRRDETTLAGTESPVRIFLVEDFTGNDSSHSRIVVRRASSAGWEEQILAEPAPSRYLDGRGGPEFALAKVDDDYWVISSHDRTDTEACSAIDGQVVWTWEAGWNPVDGRDALWSLASQGLWRHAGQDAWFLVLDQDDPFQREDVAARMGRMQRKNELPLQILDSSDFPGLNAGYLIVTPAPFTNASSAKKMTKAWGRRARAYVKQAWEAEDPCD